MLYPLATNFGTIWRRYGRVATGLLHAGATFRGLEGLNLAQKTLFFLSGMGLAGAQPVDPVARSLQPLEPGATGFLLSGPFLSDLPYTNPSIVTDIALP